MKCSSCDLEMRKGWFPMPRGLTWKEEDQKSKMSFPGGNLPGIKVCGLIPKILPAYRCDRCEIISFYFGSRSEFDT